MLLCTSLSSDQVFRVSQARLWKRSELSFQSNCQFLHLVERQGEKKLCQMWVDKGNPWLLQFWCGSYGWGFGFFLFLIASQLTDLKSENKINFFSSIYSTFDQSRQTLYLPREAVTLSRKHQVLEGRSVTVSPKLTNSFQAAQGQATFTSQQQNNGPAQL